MDSDDLVQLIAVADAGSLRAAADSLGVNRSQLRRTIDRLERGLGVALTLRGVKGVELSAAGRRVVERSRGFVAEAAAITREARKLAAKPEGSLRIISPIGIPAFARAMAIGMLRAAQPGLLLTSIESEEPERMHRGTFDLILHYGPPPDAPELVSKRVFRTPVGLFAAPSYLADRGTPESPEELAGYDLVSWVVSGLDAESWPLVAGGAVAVNPWLRGANPEAMREVVGTGQGIGLLPADFPPSPTAGPMVSVLPGVVGGNVELRTLTHYPSRSDPRLQALIENIETTLAQVDG